MSDKLSRQDLDEAQKLLEELFTVVSEQEGTKAGGIKLDKGGEALQSLRETRVTFGNPADNLIHLTPDLFDKLGVELNEIRRRQMQSQFDFYYMTLTVTMKPGRGAQFKRVECDLEFGPKGASEPIIQGIFPKSEWKEVLQFGGGMRLGLDGNLDWSAGVDLSGVPQDALAGLPADIQGKLANKNDLKAFIAVPDYAYKLGRSEIAATGEGNSTCFWRVDKPDLQEAQTASFGVVFKTPQGATSIELIGRVAVEADVPALTANVKDVFADLGGKLQSLLKRKDDQRTRAERLPIGDCEQWTLPLPR